MGARRLPRTTQEPWAPAFDIYSCGPPMGARQRGRSWEVHGCPGTSYEHPCSREPMGGHGQCSGCWQAVSQQGTCRRTTRSATVRSPGLSAATAGNSASSAADIVTQTPAGVPAYERTAGCQLQLKEVICASRA